MSNDNNEDKEPDLSYMINYIAENINTIPKPAAEAIVKEWIKDPTMIYTAKDNGVLFSSDQLSKENIRNAYKEIMDIKNNS